VSHARSEPALRLPLGDRETHAHCSQLARRSSRPATPALRPHACGATTDPRPWATLAIRVLHPSAGRFLALSGPVAAGTDMPTAAPSQAPTFGEHTVWPLKEHAVPLTRHAQRPPPAAAVRRMSSCPTATAFVSPARLGCGLLFTCCSACALTFYAECASCNTSLCLSCVDGYVRAANGTCSGSSQPHQLSVHIPEGPPAARTCSLRPGPVRRPDQ
jgi:hypothetical protein